MVLMLFAFVLVVGLGVVSVASTSSGQTSVMLTQRQADLTAQSVLNALISQIKAGKIVPDATKPFDSGQLAATNLGAYQYTVSSYNGSATDFKVAVDAWCPKWQQGSESKLFGVVHGIINSSGTLSVIAQSTGLPPTVDDSFVSNYIDGDMKIIDKGKDITLSSGTATGDIDIDGNLISSFALGSPSKPITIRATGNVAIRNGAVYANIISGGNVTFSGGSTFTGSITAAGSVTIQDSRPINGNIYANGYIYNQNGAINGDVHTNSTFTMDYGSVRNIYAIGKVTINNGSVNGNIYTNGGTPYFPSWLSFGGQIYTGAATQVSPVVVSIDTTAPAVWQVSGTLRSAMAANVKNLSLDTQGAYYTVDQNCTLKLSNFAYDSKVVFDTTKSNQDLYITLKSSDGSNTVNITNGVDLLAKGTHNVYLLLDDGNNNYVNLNTSGNGPLSVIGNINYFSNQNVTESPNLYIITTFQPNANLPSNAKITFNDGYMLYGFIYAPYFTTADMEVGTYNGTPKLYGAITASSIIFNSWNTLTYKYKEPNLTGGGSGGSSGGWVYDKTLGTYVGN